MPLRFNDGSPVPEALLADTLCDLRSYFGAVSCETQTIRGVWQHGDEEYRDDSVRVFVDAPDIAETRQFMSSFKERLKTRVRQLDIWMITYPIELM